MDRLDAMNLFVRVAELGSFSAVAKQLGVARSVVTRQIAALEAHLGVKLMARSTRRLTLTSGGTAYLEKCRVILNLVEAAETGVAEERLTPRGNIRISLPLSYGLKRLAPILLDFSQRYPEVALDMDYSDRRVNLIEEGIDLSIRVTRRLESGDVARKIGSSRMLVVAAPDYLGMNGFGAPAEALHPYIVAEPTAVASLDAVRALYRFSAAEANRLTSQPAQGLGITCQPDFIAESFLAESRVKEILLAYPTPVLGIYAMLPSNRHVPHRVRVLMDTLAERLAQK